jgi:hypothetical protein
VDDGNVGRKGYGLILFAEASRAKHKFAVKRNSWPKTRGVAMNPVDHPHGVRISGVMRMDNGLMNNRVVTINISVKLPPSRDTLPKVKRLVLSLLVELVCSVVPRRSRIKWFRLNDFSFGRLMRFRIFLVPEDRSIANWNEKNFNNINIELSTIFCDMV